MMSSPLRRWVAAAVRRATYRSWSRVTLTRRRAAPSGRDGGAKGSGIGLATGGLSLLKGLPLVTSNLRKNCIELAPGALNLLCPHRIRLPFGRRRAVLEHQADPLMDRRQGRKPVQV